MAMLDHLIVPSHDRKASAKFQCLHRGSRPGVIFYSSTW